MEGDLVRGRTVRTPKKRTAFIESLRETGGNVSRSCEAADMSRVAAYEWRTADPEFAKEWNDAVEFGTDELEEEARRRAYAGVDEPVFYQGEQCGTVRKYSDTLLIFLLKGRRPETYRDNVRTEITGKDGGPLRIAKAEDLTDDELAAIAGR